MADNFTAKQKEIVARKLGYDGPMQGFDDFISSSPALEMKYATLSDKFAQRMAKGGVVKKFAEGGSVEPTAEQRLASINAFLQTNPSPEALAAAQDYYKVDNTELARARDYGNVGSAPGSNVPNAPTGPVVGGGGYNPNWNPNDPSMGGTVEQGYSQAYTPEQLRTIRGTFDQYRNDPQKQMELMTQYGVSVDDLALARGGDRQGYQNIFLQAGADPSFGGMSDYKPTTNDKAYIDWMMTQPNPAGQGTLADVYKAQGVDPYTDPRVISQARDQNTNAANRVNMYGGAGIAAPMEQIAPWQDPNWKAKQDAAAKAERERQARMVAAQGPNVTVGGGAIRTGVSLGTSATPTASEIANTPGMGSGGIGVSTTTSIPTTTQSKFDPKRKKEIQDWYNANQGKGTQADLDKWLATSGYTAAEISDALPQWSEADLEKAINKARGTTTTPTGTLTAPTAASYTAAQTQITPGMLATTPTTGDVTSAVPAQVTEAAGVTAPGVVTAPTATAATSAPAVSAELAKLQPEQGAVSQQAQITAATQAPETTALAGVQAAQGAAAQVAGAPTRVAQAGEMIAGPAVDMGRVEQTLAATQAAQGVVSEEMTVQGQLNKLLSNFDAGAPPPWAAATMRAATAQLAARGLGASSMAGQAIVQAALESATPIAAADAKVFEQMGLQNLSNRQQIAVLTGQQRAQFLGQEFDQAFQTRVLNAARVADIANKNFDAQTTIAIENARLTNTMDVANLSARNAVVLAKAAQMSQLETTNLNNRQQAAVDNAKSFLMMDVKNLELRQQTSLFKAQEVADALLSDAALSNAVRITNANNTLEAAKISETLALTASQFNASERNKVNLANMDAANALIKFNAQEANDRQEFNTRMAAEINVVNAKILADVSTANTAAVNAANAVNAKNATELSASVYAQQSQTYRDLLSYSWKTGESGKDRITNLAIASIQKDVANIKADAESSSALGSFFGEVVKNITIADIKSIFD